ncbi:hypothetical protein [Pseudomonas aeruginosa]|uniref:hypothetical protein n=1 Tax=Pseudomonas aeruginosa TaxID=287 RepID=UPI00300559E2
MSELNKESVEQAGGDERAAFEAWSGDRFMQDTIHNRTVFGAGYRAALAQPSPAPELERPEVVGYLGRRIGMSEPGFHRSAEDAGYPGPGRKALIDLEQHDRIVWELRADRDSWAEQAEQRLADWDEMRKERDAALARVEQQERTIAGMNEAHAKLAGLYEAAQAQHSVPDVCDGKEQNAFEEWASKEGMNMKCHPLHWLFLDAKTYSARQGWKAALKYARNMLAAAPAQGGE